MSATNPSLMASEEDRSAWLKKEVQSVLGRSVKDIKWDKIGFNNFLAFVHLDPVSDASRQMNGPRTTTDEIVVRMPKEKGSNANPSLKVENEVAALKLAHSHGVPCPRILHWSRDPLYIIQERLAGVPTKRLWHTLNEAQHTRFCSSLAAVLKKMRSIPLPLSPSARYGGFCFAQEELTSTSNTPEAPSVNRTIQLGPNPLGYGGPSPTLRASLRAFFDWQMGLAAKNDFLRGWTKMDSDAKDSPLATLADRLRAFATDDEKGLDRVLRDAQEEAGDSARPVFVHGDFDLHNTLIDSNTYDVVGLVDFEFARAAPAWAEHFDGLSAFGHIHYGPEDDDPVTLRHSQALLHPEGWQSSTNPIPPGEQVGKVSGLSGDDAEDVVTWDVVHAWDKACAEQGVDRPREMGSAFATASRLHWFISDVCPWMLEDASGDLAKLSEEEKAQQFRRREQTARRLDQSLNFWGF
ncbi:hypothetical protein A4X13_0g6381 [Tilletia indica]|uniref:Aminoglycoside phosphotransferase domain-containing protein n=1 Tax=Tilletia indica TaxID=43049 RepID=A0A177TC20_9BASI|nr:hypothetical protein A4X13_0g6381 [Tilletia indica]